MVREATPIDISHVPDLVRLAEEVRATRTPRLLRTNGEDLAILMPPRRAPARRRSDWRPNEQELAAFRASAGGWKDVDTDRFLEDVYESRGSSRPPVEL